ncbi:MAG: hypothetical protein IPO28_15535 [Holophagaceae bacterium]|nr:hypothetical protein [Holophagaceae bacterium]
MQVDAYGESGRREGHHSQAEEAQPGQADEQEARRAWARRASPRPLAVQQAGLG